MFYQLYRNWKVGKIQDVIIKYLNSEKTEKISIFEDDIGVLEKFRHVSKQYSKINLYQIFLYMDEKKKIRVYINLWWKKDYLFI